MPLPLLAIAAAGFATGGGLEGVIGSGKRRREEGTASRKQAQAESNYFNFDFNQDVGAIANPYQQLATERERFLTNQTNQAAANQLGAAQQQRGGFAATQNLITQQTAASQRIGQDVGNLRAQGAQFVEQQRQQRIAQRYDQAGTLLGRADARLAAATRARQQASQAVYKGIGAGITAAAGAASAGKGATFQQQLQSSGLIPFNPNSQAQGSGAGDQFQRFQNYNPTLNG